TFAGIALALKPANALFLGGPALALLLARRVGAAGGCSRAPPRSRPPALHPPSALSLGGPALAFLLARRFGAAGLFAVALAPALIALTIWKSKGLGDVPLFAQGHIRLAAGA